MRRYDVWLTGGALAALASLHVAWGAGASFPARDRDQLAMAVAGIDVVPPRRECWAVGGLLATAACLVLDVGSWPAAARRTGVIVAAGVLGLRGLAGLTGRTSVLVPWEPAPRFVELDRRSYGPLCMALAAGTASSLRTRVPEPAA